MGISAFVNKRNQVKLTGLACKIKETLKLSKLANAFVV